MRYSTGNLTLEQVKLALDMVIAKATAENLEVMHLNSPGEPFMFGIMTNPTNGIKLFDGKNAVFSMSYRQIGSLDVYYVVVHIDLTEVSCPSFELLKTLIETF